MMAFFNPRQAQPRPTGSVWQGPEAWVPPITDGVPLPATADNSNEHHQNIYCLTTYRVMRKLQSGTLVAEW